MDAFFMGSSYQLRSYALHLLIGRLPDELGRTVDLGFDVVESDAASDLVQGHVEEARAMVGEAQDVLPISWHGGAVLVRRGG
eukprot:Skav230904  [mRNA]  locus=scaffold3693:55266:55511:+ [translate_table: standard]